MSDAVEFDRVSNDEQAEFLLPGHDDQLYLVLFCDRGAPAVEKARRLAPQLDLPDDWGFVHVDPEGAQATVRRFGLSDRTGMAAIYDGSLLTVEYECSLDAFRRLVDTARKQYRDLERLG